MKGRFAPAVPGRLLRASVTAEHRSTADITCCVWTADVNHVTIFKNHGADAGASLQHPHSQLIATPVIPGQVWHRLHELYAILTMTDNACSAAWWNGRLKNKPAGTPGTAEGGFAHSHPPAIVSSNPTALRRNYAAASGRNRSPDWTGRTRTRKTKSWR